MLVSPLSKSENVSIERKISVRELTELYSKTLGIDVSLYFKGIDEISLVRDNQTGYRFFYPYIETDSQFYERLQNFDSYYMENKWEFIEALSLIKSDSRVLEVGCGNGSFLKMLKERNIQGVGLELNKDAAEVLNKSGYNILTGSIQDNSHNLDGNFDIVVAFQVLEHINDVHTFLESLIKVLNKNGILILSVPNNNAFLKYTYPSVLNLPPHHAGWWNLESLKSICHIFNVELKNVFYEPLQPYHFDWYYYTLKYRIINYLGQWAKVFFLPFRNFRYRYLLSEINMLIKGHSIMVAFKKY